MLHVMEGLGRKRVSLCCSGGQPEEWTHTCTQNDHIEFPTESQYVSMTMLPKKCTVNLLG